MPAELQNCYGPVTHDYLLPFFWNSNVCVLLVCLFVFFLCVCFVFECSGYHMPVLVVCLIHRSSFIGLQIESVVEDQCAQGDSFTPGPNLDKNILDFELMLQGLGL